MKRHLILAVTVALVSGCGGGGNQESQARNSPPPPAAGTAASDRGVGPITEYTLGPLDTALAAHGRELFDTKCAVCHKFEERYVGPALAGVTKRRKPEWIMNMMLNPDEMIKQDPQAKALFAEYLTPMAFQNVTQEDAKAILMYFRSVESGAGE